MRKCKNPAYSKDDHNPTKKMSFVPWRSAFTKSLRLGRLNPGQFLWPLHAFITFASQASSSFQEKDLFFLWSQYWAALRAIVSRARHQSTDSDYDNTHTTTWDKDVHNKCQFKWFDKFQTWKSSNFHLFIMICFHWIKWKFNFNCLLPIVSQDMPPLLAEPVGLTMAASASASAETRQAKTRQDAKTKLNVKWKYFNTKIFLQPRSEKVHFLFR